MDGVWSIMCIYVFMFHGSLQAECNSTECSFDGWDCAPISPSDVTLWSTCSGGQACREVFLNGHCDVECNREECLYDGGDCLPLLGTCAETCTGVGGDGVCQEQCNSPECPYDGLDCSSTAVSFVSYS